VERLFHPVDICHIYFTFYMTTIAYATIKNANVRIDRDRKCEYCVVGILSVNQKKNIRK
jgi:hypothetical protein